MLILKRTDPTHLAPLAIAVVLFIVLDVSVLAMNLWISWQVEQDAVAINLAGRQRMLSQRMTKSALLLAGADAPDNRQDALDELQLSGRLFDQTLRAFARGGEATAGDNRPINLHAVSDAEAQTLVAVAGERWRPLEAAISSLAWPPSRDSSWAVAEILVQQNRGILDLMNRLTSRMEAASLAQTQRLRVVQGIAFFLALLNFGIILRMLWQRYHQAAARSQHLHEVIDQLGAGVLLLDAKGKIVSANRVAQALFGRGEAYLPGQVLDQLLRQEGEYAFGYRDSGELWVAQITYGSVVMDETPLTIATVQDVTARYEQAQSLAFQANHDPLTGLPNRRLFEDRYLQAIAYAARTQGMVGVAVIDLDKFKPINDRWGHGVGDQLLRRFAERLQGCMRASDTVARVGGDEFVCLLRDVRDEHDLVGFAQRVFRALEPAASIGDLQLQIEASMGMALFPHHGRDGAALLAAADEAMYQAKTAGQTYVVARARDLVTLHPYPGSPSSPVAEVSVSLEPLPGGDLQLAYHLSGQLDRLQWPKPAHPGFVEGLWQHTCCELFVTREGDKAYREFNFSPAGQWAVFDFGDYRQRQTLALPPAQPILSAHREGTQSATLTVTLPAAWLPPLGKPLQLGVTLVAEDTDGQLTYWALAHPGDKPDFHHRDGFIYLLTR